MHIFSNVKFNLSRDLIRQHNILRRNFPTAIQALNGERPADPKGHKVFIQEILKDLDLHHIVEDKELFPGFSKEGAKVDDFYQ